MKEYCVSVIKTFLLQLFLMSPRHNHEVILESCFMVAWEDEYYEFQWGN